MLALVLLFLKEVQLWVNIFLNNKNKLSTTTEASHNFLIFIYETSAKIVIYATSA
jgi:sRNA-binding regulator protein Hfq